jgi:toxin YoeB
MDICFHKNAFEDYIFFQKNDKKTVERIHKLLKEVERSPFTGLGKPEALKHNLSGFWSRRISNEHRLVYAIKNNSVYILQCRYHY